MEIKNFDSRSYLLGFILILAFMLIIGCAQEGQTNQNTDSSAKIWAQKSNLNQQIQANSTIIAENKTGQQHLEEAIASVVPDGTYSADINYQYHSGTNTVEISLSVQNDTITSASITAVGQVDLVSSRYISNVNSALPQLVVGQKIDQLNIPRQVAGSSLTTAAFKQYVDNLVNSHGKATS